MWLHQPQSACVQSEELDTKVLIAWGQHQIMLAFRGTASLANAKSDLKALTSAWDSTGCLLA